MAEHHWFWFESKQHSWLPVRHTGHGGPENADVGSTVAWDDVPLEDEAGQAAKSLAGGGLKEALPSTVDRHTNDLTQMPEITEATLIHDLRHRYKYDLIYTSVGPTIISINPFKPVAMYGPKVLSQYRGSLVSEQPPHAFSTAETAFVGVTEQGRPQSIVISGESGAGKSEATKLVLMYLAESSSMASRGGEPSEVSRRLLEASPILEAFGNAKTVRNNNSSRFGKWMSVGFDEQGQIVSGSITNYLLEKSRIVMQMKGERNFHVLYMLLHGLSDAELAKANLKGCKEHRATNTDIIDVPGMDDSQEWHRMVEAMDVVGIDAEERKNIASLLAAVIHLCDLEFEGEDSSAVTNTETLSFVSDLLGIPKNTCADMMTLRTMRASRASTFRIPLKAHEASDACHAIAKCIYSSLFDFVVKRINQSMVGSPAKCHTGVLDIFGYENFQQNSFEQLCINFANEKLHQLFNQYTFQLELDAYSVEGLEPPSDVVYEDNEPCLKLIEGKGGIIAMLDEECIVPQGSDAKYGDKLVIAQKSHPAFDKPKLGQQQFIVKHFAGAVKYTIDDWLDKNRDTVPSDFWMAVLSSAHPLLMSIIPAPADDGGNAQLSSRRGARKSSAKKTVADQFASQLHSLVDTIKQGDLHFIRCIKPNQKLAPDMFDGQFIMTQLRYTGMMAACEIRRKGLPVRVDLVAFQRDYKALVNESQSRDVRNILSSCGIPEQDFKCGKTKLFLKDGAFSAIAEKWRQRAAQAITTVQLAMRRKLAVVEVRKRSQAIVRIQCATRFKIARICLAKQSCIVKLDKAILNDEVEDMEQCIAELELLGEPEAAKRGRDALSRVTERAHARIRLRNAKNLEDVKQIEAIMESSKQFDLQSTEDFHAALMRIDAIKKLAKLHEELTLAQESKDISSLTDIIKQVEELNCPVSWLEGARELLSQAQAEAQLESALLGDDVASLHEKINNAKSHHCSPAVIQKAHDRLDQLRRCDELIDTLQRAVKSGLKDAMVAAIQSVEASEVHSQRLSDQMAECENALEAAIEKQKAEEAAEAERRRKEAAEAKRKAAIKDFEQKLGNLQDEQLLRDACIKATNDGVRCDALDAANAALHIIGERGLSKQALLQARSHNDVVAGIVQRVLSGKFTESFARLASATSADPFDMGKLKRALLEVDGMIMGQDSLEDDIMSAEQKEIRQAALKAVADSEQRSAKEHERQAKLRREAALSILKEAMSRGGVSSLKRALATCDEWDVQDPKVAEAREIVARREKAAQIVLSLRNEFNSPKMNSDVIRSLRSAAQDISLQGPLIERADAIIKRWDEQNKVKQARRNSIDPFRTQAHTVLNEAWKACLTPQHRGLLESYVRSFPLRAGPHLVSTVPFRHSAVPLKQPLSRLPTNLVPWALEMFKAILGFAGDRPYVFPHLLAQEVLSYTQLHPALRDEAWYQIAKQMTSCPRPDVVRRLWVLCFLLTRVCLPSEAVRPYILATLAVACGRPPRSAPGILDTRPAAMCTCRMLVGETVSDQDIASITQQLPADLLQVLRKLGCQ